jgi:hypothetical protein
MDQQNCSLMRESDEREPNTSRGLVCRVAENWSDWKYIVRIERYEPQLG